MYKASLVIAFYNKIDILKLVFAGLERQTSKEFEVIIADDGSRSDVVKELKNMISGASFDVQHIWHEDDGWRKNIILNQAIKASKSDFVIFIDSDCIPHRCFVEEHIKNRSKNTILAGRRANLSEELTSKITVDTVASGQLENMAIPLLISSLKKETNFAEKSIYVKSKFLRKLIQKKRATILGCNFSMNMEDIVALNGFDERYLAPTCGEDTDIQVRALNLGLKLKSISNMAIQYHLYHKKLSRENDNIKILRENERIGMKATPYGLNKLKG